MIILSIGILILSIVCHEFGHAIMAYGLGDPTAKREGRLSLNPIVHLDLLGSVIVPALLWITNTGFLFGWARPVPVDCRYFKSPRYGMVMVALAGPMVNFLLILIGLYIMKSYFNFSFIFDFAQLLFSINLVLMVFNLIPIPPLDGSRVIGGFLPPSLAVYWQKLDRYGGILLVIFIMCNGVDFVFSYFIPLLSKILLF